MTDDQVQEALVRWLHSVTGLTVIKAHQGVNRPEIPYLMVEKAIVEELSQNPEQIKFEELNSVNSADLRELKATPLLELEWLMLVYSFGEGQSSALRKVKQAVHLGQIQESLGTALNIHETGVINSIPEFVDESWEPRSQMNIMVRGVSDDGFIIDTIEEYTAFSVETV